MMGRNGVETMTIDKSRIISLLPSAEASDLMRNAHAFLKQSDTREVYLVPRVEASHALQLWRTRRKNTERTKLNIEGIDSLLESLERLPPDIRLDQLSFKSESKVGIFFFRSEDAYQFVGVIMAPRQRMEGLAPDLELR
jgi:hypothetical protein